MRVGSQRLSPYVSLQETQADSIHRIPKATPILGPRPGQAWYQVLYPFDRAVRLWT